MQPTYSKQISQEFTVNNDFEAPSTCSKYIRMSLNFIYKTTAEEVAFFIAAAVVRIFIPPLTAPLLGIGCALLTTRLVLKIFNRYNNSFLIELTKEACKFNAKHPKLQLIGFIFSLAISFLSRTLGLLSGIAVGSFSAIILDVEKYKLLQQANRIK